MARTYQKKSGKAVSNPASAKGAKLIGPSKSTKKGRNRGKESLKARILKWFGVVMLCGIVAAIFFAAGGYLGLVRSVGELGEPQVTSSHPTYIYSEPVGEAAGTTRVIGTIFEGENRKAASVDEMPASLLDALVAKEDARFREHAGVDIAGIMRALWVDIRAGEAVEGASTITQQYVKNAYLSQDRSISRKLKEATISIEIERRYEKDKILGMYLNTVYFGSNAYGVGAAAETYFNKSVDDLTLSESATLVGLLWSPSTLGTDPDGAAYQRNLVLEKMFKAGYISRQDHRQALDEALPEPWPKAPMIESGLTGPPEIGDFAETVREELVNEYGAATVLQGGLSVYTTLDLKAQMGAREMLYGPAGFLAYPDDPDAALLSIEPETGYIRTMVGDRDQESQFNLATQARRQPGSSFKPFALIAAIEQGVDPQTTQFVSEKKRYTIQDAEGRPEKWNVDNFEEEHRGPITLEQALWFSDNSVFTDLVMNVDGKGLENGPEAIADVAHRLGVTAELDTSNPSIVLGSQEVSPMDMATAYATIANGGRLVSPTGIRRVVQNEGEETEKILREEGDRPEGEQVIDPEVARAVTEVMIGDVTRGIATKANLADRPVAGKSGTSENFFDSWFVGFTPNLVTGVWMGYAEGGATLKGLLALDSRTQQGPIAPPTVIFQTHMQRVLEGEPAEEFEGVEGPQTMADDVDQNPNSSPSPEGMVPATNQPANMQQPSAEAVPGPGEATNPIPAAPPVPSPVAPAGAPTVDPSGGAAAVQYGF
ncbi:MAG: transglycosylase domain-containing protein [Actinomycetota bacterium]|nr:transglycosylase domain-containing protein [Actinomycetota bacterium]